MSGFCCDTKIAKIMTDHASRHHHLYRKTVSKLLWPVGMDHPPLSSKRTQKHILGVLPPKAAMVSTRIALHDDLLLVRGLGPFPSIGA